MQTETKLLKEILVCLHYGHIDAEDQDTIIPGIQHGAQRNKHFKLFSLFILGETQLTFNQYLH